MIVESIENEFLTIIDRRQAKRVPRLQLNVDDHAFFDELIGRAPVQMEPARESHRRLADDKSYIDGLLTRLVEKYDKMSQLGVLSPWRTEERRHGTECVSTCRYWWSTVY